MKKEYLESSETLKKEFLYCNQQFKGIFAFLHNVLYIPTPKMMAAKAANGIKMNILVLRPMYKIKLMHIKL